MNKIAVHHWQYPQPASENEIRRLLTQEGLLPYSWSNGPGDAYAPHRHSYNKVIYVIQGDITFGLPESASHIQLTLGDRLDLPRDVLHDAIVGPSGVICLEAHC